MGPGGAFEGLIQAKEKVWVQFFLGVTGHGTYAPAMHVKSLETYEFNPRAYTFR